MSLDDFIITCFCWIDEALPTAMEGKRLRQSGPAPKMSDSEVITIELVGSYLGLSQDQELFEYFGRHSSHFFPELLSIHRSTFVRQAANLWAIKERLWMRLRDGLLRHDELVGIIDSMPLPVCRFARAPWCVRFRGQARYGKDHADCQTFYGFRLHLRLGLPGVITHAFLAPANETDGEMAPIVLGGTQGLVLGDRAYWVPDIQAGSVRTQREACFEDRLRGMMGTITSQRRSASCIAHTAPQSRSKNKPRRRRSAIGCSVALLVSTSLTSVQERRSTSWNILPMWFFWLSCGGSGRS